MTTKVVAPMFDYHIALIAVIPSGRNAETGLYDVVFVDQVFCHLDCIVVLLVEECPYLGIFQEIEPVNILAELKDGFKRFLEICSLHFDLSVEHFRKRVDLV